MPSLSVRHLSGTPELYVDGVRHEVVPPTPWEAVRAVEALTRPDLGDVDNWWEPLYEPLCTRWIEFEAARRTLEVAAHRFPSAGVTVETSKPRLWRALDGHSGVRVEVSPVRSVQNAIRTLRSPGRGDLLKFHGRDLTVRRAASARRSKPAVVRNPWLAVIEVPTPSMSENLLAMAELLPSSVLSCDPRVAATARQRGLPTYNVWAQRGSRPSSRIGRRLVEALRSGDATYAAAVGPGIGRLADHLVVDRLRLRRWLQTLRPETVVLASDQHRFGVLATWEAASLGVRSVVVQHGFADHPLGYLPVRADRVAAIGPASRRWFLDHGTDPQAVVATGSPRFPEFRDFDRSRSRRRVTIPLNANAAPILRGLLAAASSLTDAGFELVLRPHPGDRHLSGLDAAGLLRSFGLSPSANVVVDEEPDIADALAGSALVLNWDSSVLYEALCLGVPVALYEDPNSTNPFAGSDLPTFSTATDLSQLVSPSGWDRAIDLCERARSALVSAGGPSAVASIARISA